jgi:hypothetical protein
LGEGAKERERGERGGGSVDGRGSVGRGSVGRQRAWGARQRVPDVGTLNSYNSHLDHVSR